MTSCSGMWPYHHPKFQLKAISHLQRLCLKGIRPKSLLVNYEKLLFPRCILAYSFYPCYLVSHFWKLCGIPSNNLPHLVSWLAGGSCSESLEEVIKLIFVHSLEIFEPLSVSYLFLCVYQYMIDIIHPLVTWEIWSGEQDRWESGAVGKTEVLQESPESLRISN